MSKTMRSVAVLGAGTMGAQIAAHFANADVPVVLLDVTADVAREGLKRARSLKPDPFFTPETASRITTGGLDTDFAALASVDWIMEAVVEQLDIKRALLERVDAVRRPGTIVSSNTSGIPIATLAEGRSDDFRRHLLGTHFFNPPRYLHLVEVIPTAETDPDVVERVSQFADHRLGKGVVVAKDTPNFIGNHLALYGVMLTLKALESGRYTIEEIDAMTGPALGRPKSATFRTMDIAGIDILAHVARNLGFELPAFVTKMIEKGMVGEKAGQGFYKRVPSTGSGQGRTSGGSEILTLDPATLEYRPKQPARIASIEAGKSIEDTGERIKALFNAKDKAGDFLRETLGPTLEYTARVTPDIAYSPDDVDRVMRWGFGWELGPFAIMEALGIGSPEAHVARKRSAERPVDPEIRTRAPAHRPQEHGREPRGSRRRRPRARVPREDERARRRPDPDDPRRGQGSGGEFRGAGGRQRRGEFFRGRKPDAAPARSAGRQLGRDRSDDSHLPGRDPGAALRRRPGDRRAGRA